MAICLRAALVSALVLWSSGAVQPARLANGSLPPLPLAVGGGEVILELTVASDGTVRNTRTLRTTPPYADAVVKAVSEWRFFPAERVERRSADGRVQDSLVPVDSTVLVAAVFRPPSMHAPTLGDVPRDMSTATSAPYPIVTIMPPFPPRARDGGIVLVEAAVDSTARIVETRVVRSQPPFDDAALSTLREWRFRPASTLSYVYVMFGFQPPVVDVSTSARRMP